MFRLFILISSIFAITFSSFGQKPKYIGANRCKSCHKKEEKGAQYKIWSEKLHAKAFETLKTKEALEVAKKAGVTEPPHESPKCLPCHTTGYDKGGYEVITDEAFWNPEKSNKKGKKAMKRMKGLASVGCEACHGPGSLYKGKKNMGAIFSGDLAGEEVGLIMPTEEVCKGCHNEDSPTYKPFDFDERKEEIKHSFPDGYRK